MLFYWNGVPCNFSDLPLGLHQLYVDRLVVVGEHGAAGEPDREAQVHPLHEGRSQVYLCASGQRELCSWYLVSLVRGGIDQYNPPSITTIVRFRKGSEKKQSQSQKHNRPKALSTLTHSTPSSQSRSFIKL